MYHWEDLIEFIHQHKRVIPIVGKEFSLVRQGDAWWPLEKVLIQRMGAEHTNTMSAGEFFQGC